MTYSHSDQSEDDLLAGHEFRDSIASCNTSRDCRGSTQRFASPRNVPCKLALTKPLRLATTNEYISPKDLKRKFDFSDSYSNTVPSPYLINGNDDASDEAESDEIKYLFNRASRKAVSPPKKVRHFNDLHEETKLLIFSYLFQTNDLIRGPWAVCRSWNRLCRHANLWKKVRSFKKGGSINEFAFRFLGMKNQGTEGQCFKVLHRRSGRFFAMKRARVYPSGEGVPYYMLRELAFLKGLRHPNIATVERISLSSNKLYLFFDYVEKSLFDLINPNNDVNGGISLPQVLVKRFLYQVSCVSQITFLYKLFFTPSL